MAAAMVISGSVLAVIFCADQLRGIHSLETRAMITRFLADSGGAGLDVPAALLVFRTALMVLAGCATAAAILGYHVLQRVRSARLGLTVLAVPLFVAGLAAGGLLTSLVVIAALLLWVDPSRSWLDRRPLPEPPPPLADRPPPAATAWPPPGSAPQQGEVPPQGDVPPQGGVPPRAEAPPPHPSAFGAAPATWAPPGVQPDRRPEALVWACVTTWAFSGLAFALMAGSLTLLLVDPSLMWAELERQNPGLVAQSGLSRTDLLRTTYVTLGVGIAWAASAMVLAFLTFRRRAAGRIALLVCAGLAGVLCTVGSFGAGVLLVPAVACVATVLLLVRPDVNAWFAVRRPHP